jgi:hypothetical protein
MGYASCHLLLTEVSTFIGWYTRNRMHNPMIKVYLYLSRHSFMRVSTIPLQWAFLLLPFSLKWNSNPASIAVTLMHGIFPPLPLPSSAHSTVSTLSLRSRACYVLSVIKIRTRLRRSLCKKYSVHSFRCDWFTVTAQVTFYISTCRPSWTLIENSVNIRNIRLFIYICLYMDRLCGLVVRVLGYRSGGPGSIPSTTKKM